MTIALMPMYEDEKGEDVEEEIEETLTNDELMELAEISEEDIAEAIVWWDELASDTWKGILDEQGRTGSID